MRSWVTGADGFVGRHLAAAFREAGDEVLEAHGPAAAGGLGLDVRDASAVAARVAEVKPDVVVHLAGASSVAASHVDPAGCLAVNVGGTLNVLAAVRTHAPSARVLLVSSGEVYGAVAEGVPVSEEAPLSPLSPYAASKVSAEVMGLQFHRAYGLDVVVARPFNHLGTGQAPGFVVPSFARQLVDIRAGRAAPVLKVGNLSPVRDFSHVLDVVEGYRLLLERGRAGEVYNVCSGEGRSIRAVLEALCRQAGVEVSVEVDPARVRPAELPWLVGSAGKLEALGWRRSRGLEEALAAVLAEAATPSPP